MREYLVNEDLYGVPAGTIERFSDHAAAPLVMAGKITPVDPVVGTCPMCGRHEPVKPKGRA